jgi:hypothetical protein
MPKSTAPKRRRSPPKISAVEKTAVRIMRKLYEATGGQPQRWESLVPDNRCLNDSSQPALLLEPIGDQRDETNISDNMLTAS